MKRRLVRCYRGLASLPGSYNVEVLYTLPEMYRICLYTCIECGELFVIDFENPKVAGKTVAQIAGRAPCPRCGRVLADTLMPYPEYFRNDDGRIGTFTPEHRIPPDSESLVREFFEID